MAEEVIKTTSCCNDAMMGGLLGAMANRDNNNPLAMAAMMRDRDDADMWFADDSEEQLMDKMVDLAVNWLRDDDNPYGHCKAWGYFN